MGATLVKPFELEAFLEAYVRLRFNFSAAAKAIGRNPHTIREHIRNNEDFAKRFYAARFDMAQEVLAEAFRRAVDGYDEPLANQGVLTGDVVRKYSDSALLKLLGALLPEFGDKTKLEVTNPDGSLNASDAQVAARLASIFAVAQARKARGEVMEGEIVEPAALPSPHEDLL